MNFKFYLLASILLIPIAKSYALPCPNGEGVLYKGDSIESVIQQCGEPSAKRQIFKETFIVEEWVYYRGHAFDTGYSQVILLFNNNLVSSIRVYEVNPYLYCQLTLISPGPLITTQLSCGNFNYDTGSVNLCGTIISVGAPKSVVLAACGNPSYRIPLQTQSFERTEIRYDGNNPQAIIFENGRLIEWR